MDLNQHPRRIYNSQKTPIIKLKKLSEYFGKCSIFIKRDDFLDLAGGGNKTRKLEFVVGDALSKGADTLITCGGLQSNHCRLTAAAAVKEGLKCRLVLIEEPHQTYKPKAGGNNLLYHLLGVETITVIRDLEKLDDTMDQAADQVKREGGIPYLIPMGASNPIGTLGYMACAQEIVDQASAINVHFNYIICPSGSAGTQAGLIMGMACLKYPCRVLGMNVSRSKEEQHLLLRDLINHTISSLKLDVSIQDNHITCFDKSLGPGYAIPSPEMVEAVKLLAATEGILLDPVYTGKAMAGLIMLIKNGFFKQDDQVLFIHTGGLPALYSCPEIFLD